MDKGQSDDIIPPPPLIFWVVEWYTVGILMNDIEICKEYRGNL